MSSVIHSYHPGYLLSRMAAAMLVGLFCLSVAAADGPPDPPGLENMPHDEFCILMGMLGPIPPFCEEEAPPPIEAFPLSAHRSVLTDDVEVTIDLDLEGRDPLALELDDPSRVTVVKFVIQPGAIFPWHTHPGPVFTGVDEGEGGLVYIYADDCERRHYEVGTMFVDPGGDNVHTAYNPSDSEETIVVGTFFDVPDADEDGTPAPLAIPVDEELGQALDQECDIDR